MLFFEEKFLPDVLSLTTVFIEGSGYNTKWFHIMEEHGERGPGEVTTEKLSGLSLEPFF